MIITKKDNKTFFTEKDTSIKILELEKGLNRIRIDNFDSLAQDEKQTFISEFTDYCKKNEISLLTSENNIENNYLADFGFQIYRTKTLFQKKLNKIEEFDKKLCYKSISEVTEVVFKTIFIKAVTDFEEKDGYSNEDYFDYLKELAEDKYNEENWKLVLKNDEPIGVILPQIFPDNEKEGTLYFLGLLEDQRNKGYGKEMHLEGLNILFENGATEYIGSTLNSNQAMTKLFHKNKCEIQTIQYFFKPQ
jgi:ribosomal protein S18 acetylase RimI-like enzyme